MLFAKIVKCRLGPIYILLVYPVKNKKKLP